MEMIKNGFDVDKDMMTNTMLWVLLIIVVLIVITKDGEI